MKSESEQCGTGTGTGTGKGTTAIAANSRGLSQLLLANLWLLLIPFWHAIWPPIKCGHFAFSSPSLSLSICVFFFFAISTRCIAFATSCLLPCPNLTELKFQFAAAAAVQDLWQNLTDLRYQEASSTYVMEFAKSTA